MNRGQRWWNVVTITFAHNVNIRVSSSSTFVAQSALKINQVELNIIKIEFIILWNWIIRFANIFSSIEQNGCSIMSNFISIEGILNLQKESLRSFVSSIRRKMIHLKFASFRKISHSTTEQFLVWTLLNIQNIRRFGKSPKTLFSSFVHLPFMFRWIIKYHHLLPISDIVGFPSFE